MEAFFAILLLLILVFGLPKVLEKLGELFPDNRQKSDSDSLEKKVMPNDDSLKIEAVKRQIERNISAPTNKPVSAANKPFTLTEKVASAPFVPVEVKPPVHTQEKQVVKINIEPNEVKSQAASEIIGVPKGVIVKVKRVRVVEHSVNIEWSSAITGKGEVGIKQLVSASIQGEIQRVKGYVLQQTESMEYEITLDGEKHTQYQLIWMDVWLKGVAEIQETANSYQQPFQFRDRAELKVVPMFT